METSEVEEIGPWEMGLCGVRGSPSHSLTVSFYASCQLRLNSSPLSHVSAAMVSAKHVGLMTMA